MAIVSIMDQYKAKDMCEVSPLTVSATVFEMLPKIPIGLPPPAVIMSRGRLETNGVHQVWIADKWRGLTTKNPPSSAQSDGVCTKRI